MNVNLELYKVFYYVAKYLSFSEAAGHLYLSQSAVSQSIRLLEEKLDCKLFIRSTKQVKLTQEGEMLFKHVEQALNFIDAGERSINEFHSLKQGEVRIGASDTICKYYLLPYFKQFNQLYPNIKIHVTNRTSPMCIELLKKGMLDVAVISLPAAGVPEGIHAQPIKEIQDVFIAGNRFRHLHGRVIPLTELAALPLLMLEKNSVTRLYFDEWTKQYGITITPEIELSSVDLLIELTKIGLGITFVSREYITNELSSGEVFIVNVQEEILPRPLGIITHTTIPVPAAAKAFIELLERK